VRFRQAGESQAEGGLACAVVARSSGAEAWKSRIELDAGAEEENVALEGRQPERCRERFEHGGPPAQADGLRRLSAGVSLERCRDPTELAAQGLLVLDDALCHGSVSTGFP
jgi:hypothetical protein